MRQRLVRLIRAEIANKKAGKPAMIFLKLNNLVDEEFIRVLYDASKAGVPVKLIVRGMFSLVPGIPGLSENIEAISIVDRFLEHTRIFMFANGGDPKYYISSADLMSRNLDRRSEVICPIYDKACKQELQAYLDLQWRDNVKARILDYSLDNQFRPRESGNHVRAQVDIYEMLDHHKQAPKRKVSEYRP